MNIEDPEVRRLASALAGQRHTSVTAAVREALRGASARHEQSRAGPADRLLALAERSRTVEEPVLGDDDRYGERGVPRCSSTPRPWSPS